VYFIRVIKIMRIYDFPASSARAERQSSQFSQRILSLYPKTEWADGSYAARKQEAIALLTDRLADRIPEIRTCVEVTDTRRPRPDTGPRRPCARISASSS
jgi:hypothetical protein